MHDFLEMNGKFRTKWASTKNSNNFKWKRLRIFHNLICTKRNLYCVCRTLTLYEQKNSGLIHTSAPHIHTHTPKQREDTKRINCRTIHTKCVKSENLWLFVEENLWIFRRFRILKAFFRIFSRNSLGRAFFSSIFLVACFFYFIFLVGYIIPGNHSKRRRGQRW